MHRITFVVAALLVVPLCARAQSSNEQHGTQTAASQSENAASKTSDEPSLDAVRDATLRYRDLNVALAEGYLMDPMGTCETAALMGQDAGLGAMGVHYFRPDLLGVTETHPRVNGVGTYMDFLQPSILIYEPQADGSMELVAVENLVFKKAWEEAGNTELPSFHGQSYNLMQDDPATEIDEAHMFEPHYDLHVWVHRKNPNGPFTPFNPDVDCSHSKPAQNPAGQPAPHQPQQDHE